MVKRIFVEKKPGFNVEADHLLRDINETFHLKLEDLRIINCYEIEGIDEATLTLAKEQVFSEPNVDTVYDSMSFESSDACFRYQLLPGQFDQRADSAEQCIQLITGQQRPTVQASRIICLYGDTACSLDKIKKYLINPVESHEIGFEEKFSLSMTIEQPKPVPSYEGFIEYSFNEILSFKKQEGFAMTEKDLLFIQSYFKEEQRNPTVTELKAIDTYWSDHCRHTTFLTEIDDVKFEDDVYTAPIKESFLDYVKDREKLKITKPMTLMNLATIAVKKRQAEGLLQDLDISEEINACSIEVMADVDGKEEPYLVMFKNETHNHPTEIEPFGGAATCLGGAIRDPLSGRAYVYQAMRVTGAADPRVPIESTLPGKLPQKTITTVAAKGYSSYGNQIGVTTGHVKEYYHDGFLAKRMEVGAVIAATPKNEVIRLTPEPGDVVVLVGGLTGRDGCGGATGSSKAHTETSINECGSEVQKGNAPVERKLQRLFRQADISKMIKRCNDFGAGGVSVAIGEIAESLDIDLNQVPKKYEGLDGTELAISESQERMAVVIAKDDLEAFIEGAAKENLLAVQVAKVTDSGYLKMTFNGQEVFKIKRSFLDSSGVRNHTAIEITKPETPCDYFMDQRSDIKTAWLETMGQLNVCSQKGLVEQFDSTIGANSVLMPFGGKTYETPTQGMVAKIPVKGKETTTATIMTHGYQPKLASWSPYHGGMYAVVESVAKTVAMGGDYSKLRFSFQEYFERLNQEPKKWGKPLAALLGANKALDAFESAAIGGKDSMSGSFNDIHVPPSLIAFGVAPIHVDEVITPELKSSGHDLVLFEAKRFNDETIDFDHLLNQYKEIHTLMKAGDILSAYAIGEGGLLASLSQMSFGNKVGFELNVTENLLNHQVGSIVVEMKDGEGYKIIGHTTEAFKGTVNQETLDLEEVLGKWQQGLDKVFTRKEDEEGHVQQISYRTDKKQYAKVIVDQPKVVIPAFPGTNCEDDTKKAFEKVGAIAEVVVIRNLNAVWIEDSIQQLVKGIRSAQIIALPGGFSAGDEPDGSGKFIASVFRHPEVKAAVSEFLNERDGLMIGICNGFQALIKLGLLPYGEIKALDDTSPTLTFNRIGRHVARYAKTRIASNLSPWLQGVSVGDVHEVALSHGEGRFYADEDMLRVLEAHGQIATQYVDASGQPSHTSDVNPNGSVMAIEGITSKDGRIFGKMGHSERVSYGVAKNIYGEKEMKIFESGVNYFRGL